MILPGKTPQNQPSPPVFYSNLHIRITWKFYNKNAKHCETESFGGVALASIFQMSHADPEVL